MLTCSKVPRFQQRLERRGILTANVSILFLLMRSGIIIIIIIIIINGRENKFTSAIIITCRPILTSRDLQTSRLGL